MLHTVGTNRFEKNLALCKKRGYDMELFKEVARLLSEEKPLPQKYKAHKLNPYSSGRWDCHIKDDWVLIYRFDYVGRKVIFEDTGTHSDLF
jgi:mRNA interferase YafQ